MAEPLGDLGELRAALDSGGVSSVELVERSLARAEAVDPKLHVLLGTRGEAAQREAAAADARRRRGETRSPLDGIPFVIKDNIGFNLSVSWLKF